MTHFFPRLIDAVKSFVDFPSKGVRLKSVTRLKQNVINKQKKKKKLFVRQLTCKELSLDSYEQLLEKKVARHAANVEQICCKVCSVHAHAVTLFAIWV